MGCIVAGRLGQELQKGKQKGVVESASLWYSRGVWPGRQGVLKKLRKVQEAGQSHTSCLCAKDEWEAAMVKVHILPLESEC